MRYFNCVICEHNDVGQSEISSWTAPICESCREKDYNKDTIRELDNKRSDDYFKKGNGYASW